MWFRSDLTVSTSNLKAGDWDESDGMNSLCISIASGHEQIGTWLQFGHSGILGVSAIPYIWQCMVSGHCPTRRQAINPHVAAKEKAWPGSASIWKLPPGRTDFKLISQKTGSPTVVIGRWRDNAPYKPIKLSILLSYLPTSQG